MKRDLCDYVANGIMMLLICVFGYIILCFGLKNICYNIFEIKNPITNYFAKEDLEKKKIDIDWEELYPFPKESMSESNLVKSIINKYLDITIILDSKVNSVLSQYMPGKYKAAQVLKRIELTIGYDLQVSNNVDDIIYLQNGSLTYVQPKTDYKYLKEIADSVYEFANYLNTQNIPFFYANVGSKVCPFNKQMYPENVEYSNENATVFLSMLEERNIDYIDFRKEIILSELDWYDSYYITDHHWKTETALWASDIISEKLNHEYGFSFDNQFFKKENYNITVYRDYWIGSLGREDAFATINLEPYSLILPKYETNYTIKIPTAGIELTGDYTCSLFDMEHFRRVGNYTSEQHLNQPDAYHSIIIDNYPLINICNNLPNNNNKKILFIQDSYGWYTVSYLASDITFIDTIFLMSFNGSIRRYIEETKPDIVIMMYDARKLDARYKTCFDLK